MHIDVIPNVDEIKNDDLFQKTVIILDILRTSSTIIAALGNGCQYIVPAETVGHAKMLKNQNSNYLLAGERFYKKIAGFDLGNSPFEMTFSPLDEKSIVLTTTNGVRGIQKAYKGENVLIGGFLNGSYCIQQALALKKDIVIVAVGDKGKFSLEDGLAAGFFIDLIIKSMEEMVETNDLGIALHGMYKYYEKDIVNIIKTGESAKKLIQHGSIEDIVFSCQKNKYAVCPYVNSDQIVEAR